MPLKKEVKEEPKRVIPVSKPDVLTERDRDMIKAEKKERIVEGVSFTIVYLLTATLILRIMGFFIF